MEQIKKFVKDVKSSCNTPAKVKGIYKKCKYSVSKIIETLSEPFDKEGVAERTFNSHFNDPNSIYFHKSKAEIIEMWEKKAETGRNNGKALDNFIGMILDSHETEEILNKFKESLNETASAKCSTFESFYNTNILNKLEFLMREQILCDEETGVVGRFDAMFMAGDKLLVIDWKNTENITTSNPYKKLKGPLYNYDACDLNTYTIQVYIYTYIIRKKYNLKNIKIVPLIVQMGTEEYKMYVPQIPYSDELIEKIIEYAIGEINNKIND
jgi:ATP-dependent exoDNAse (exonuclease V) beta subunit